MLELRVTEVIRTLNVTASVQCTDSLRFNKCSCGAQVAWLSLLPSVTAPSRWASLNNSWAVRIGMP